MSSQNPRRPGLPRDCGQPSRWRSTIIDLLKYVIEDNSLMSSRMLNQEHFQDLGIYFDVYSEMYVEIYCSQE